MAILITGERGFVGSHVTSCLKERGYDVFFLNCDISNREKVLGFVSAKSVEAVIHLAGVSNKKNEKLYQRINVEGTKNIADLCKKMGVGRIVFMSSSRVNSSFSNPYIDSKREAEKIVVNSGIPYIILRPSIVYGPGDKKNIGFLLKTAKTLSLIPLLKFRLQPLFVGDLAKVVDGCLGLAPSRAINIIGPTISYEDFLKLFREMGYKFYFFRAPWLLAWLIKIVSRLPFSPMPYWQVQSLLADEVYKGDDWQRIFNIKETSLKDGIVQTVKFL
jgi:nucleoside-diphosphate-sugar epimerase